MIIFFALQTKATLFWRLVSILVCDFSPMSRGMNCLALHRTGVPSFLWGVKCGKNASVES